MRFGDGDKAQVYYEFGKLLAAGFGIDQAARAVLEREPSGAMRVFAEGVRDGVAAGKTIGEAVREVALPVTALEWRLVVAGERAGRLDEAFAQLARYFEMVERGAKRVRSGLVYPVVLLHFGVVLPALPRAVAGGGGLGGFVGSVVLQLGVLYVVTGLAVVVWRWWSARARRDAAADVLLGRVPVVGAARRALALGRFCKVMEIFLLSGQRVSDAVEAAGEASGSGALAAVGRGVAGEVAAGEPVGRALLARRREVPLELARSLATAEEAGTLEKDLGRWAALYQVEAEAGMERVARWLPRVIYGLVLVLVAYQVVVLFLDTYLGVYRTMDGMFE